MVSPKNKVTQLLIFGLVLLICSVTAISSMSFKRKIKVMPLGDSITGSWNGQASYRYYLWKLIEIAGFQDQVEFIGPLCGVDQGGSDNCGQPAFDCSLWSCAHSGFHDRTSGEVLNMLPNILSLNNPDIVLLHIGTNDFFSGVALNQSVANVSAIIDTLRNHNPNVTVLLSKIIPTQSFMQPLVDFNTLISQIGTQKNNSQSPVIIIDQFTGYNPMIDNNDAVHPGPSGDQKIANKYYEGLLPVLNSIVSLKIKSVTPEALSIYSSGNTIHFSAIVNAYPTPKNVNFIINDQDSLNTQKVDDTTYTGEFVPGSSGFFRAKVYLEDNIGNSDEVVRTLIVPNNTEYLPLSIMDIQGKSNTSPYGANFVKTRGVVTAIVNDQSGFWLQDTTGDLNDSTSDAIFVSHNSSSSSTIAIGNYVSLCGIVEEYVPGIGCFSTTRLIAVDSLMVIGSGALPAGLVVEKIIPIDTNKALMQSIYQKVEGMRITVPNAIVTSSSPVASIIPRLHQYSGFGFYPKHGVAINELSSSGVVDYNPEILLLGSKCYTTSGLRIGDTIYNLSGNVSYNEKGVFVVEADSSVFNSSRHSITIQSPVSKRIVTSGNISITTLNLSALFDTVNQWGKNDSIITSLHYNNRINKIMLAIVHELRLPGLLCVQNVENQAILQQIAIKVNGISGRGYKAFSLESMEHRGLENGFLYDTSVVTLTEGYLLNSSESSFGVNTQQQLAGSFNVNGIPLKVLNVNLETGDSDVPRYGMNWPWVRFSETIRSTQASLIRNWIDSCITQNPGGHILVAGELNDYSFTEPGENLTPVQIITGLMLPESRKLLHIGNYLPSSERFTSIKNGRAAMTSTICITKSMLPYAKGGNVLHFNTVYEDSFTDDASTPIRCSPFDALEILF